MLVTASIDVEESAYNGMVDTLDYNFEVLFPELGENAFVRFLEQSDSQRLSFQKDGIAAVWVDEVEKRLAGP